MTIKVVQPRDWRCKPLPEARRPLEYSRVLSATQAERARAGFMPFAMEDKWFIVFDHRQLLFYRSWTGNCIFGVTMQPLPTGEVQLSDAWITTEVKINRHPSSASDDLDWQVELLVSDWFQMYKELGPYGPWPEPIPPFPTKRKPTARE